MIWNTIPNGERLSLWKKMRDDIKDLSLKEQLRQVAIFCAQMPYGTRTIDYYSPKSWPTPWEILFHGEFCTSSISLLMFYTLTLLPCKESVELLLVEDNQGIYLLPIIDNQYVLNYILGEVSIHSNICNEIKILQRYSREQIKTIT